MSVASRVLLLLLASASDLLLAEQEPCDLRAFAQYKADFGKTYRHGTEELTRMKAFCASLLRISEDPSSLGLNSFSDLTEEEFTATYLHGSNRMADTPQLRYSRVASDCLTCARFPNLTNFSNNTLDWELLGAVTQVKDQGRCGACYAFAATGTLEGAQFAQSANSTLPTLSEQELVSCSGNQGCGGGDQARAAEHVVTTKGLRSESDYPYISGRDGKTPACSTMATALPPAVQVSAIVTDYQAPKGALCNVPTNETVIQEALVKFGPLAAGYNANGMRDYKRGVLGSNLSTFHVSQCRDGCNHAVLIVGMGVDLSDPTQPTPYWRVKNSWGTSWGERGFFRVAKEMNTGCITLQVFHAVRNATFG